MNVKARPPPTGEPLDSFGLKAALEQQDAQTLLSELPRLREHDSAQIEMLIRLLDSIDHYASAHQSRAPWRATVSFAGYAADAVTAEWAAGEAAKRYGCKVRRLS